MARLYSYRDGTGITVADERVDQLIFSGDYSFLKGNPVFVLDKENSLYKVPAEKAHLALEAGYTYAPESIKEQKLLRKGIEEEGVVGDIKSAGMGFARGLTFGLSDGLLKKMGMSSDEIRMYREENPISSAGGELASFFVPYLGAGAAARGASRVVQGATRMAGTLAGKAPLAGKISEKILKSRPILGAAGGGAEGATIGSMYAASDFLLDDEENIPLVTDHIWAGAKWGAATGGVIGSLFSVLKAGKSKLTEATNFRYWKSLDPRNPELNLVTRKLGFPERVQELGQFIRSMDKQGELKNLGNHEATWREINEELLPKVGQDLGTIIKSITKKSLEFKSYIADLMFDPKAVAQEMRHQILDKMLLKGASTDPFMIAKTERAAKSIDAFEDLAFQGQYKVWKQLGLKNIGGKKLTFMESEEQKRIFQKFLANFKTNPGDADYYNVMAGIIREASEDSLNAIAARLGSQRGVPMDLVEKFKSLKNMYGSLALTSQVLEGAMAREMRNNMFGLTDYIMGSAMGGSAGIMMAADSILSGGLSAGVVAGATMVGRKYLREGGDLLAARSMARLDDYGGMTNLAQKSEREIQTWISRIAQGSPVLAPKFMGGISPTSPSPEKTISDFKKTRDELNDMVGNPKTQYARYLEMVPEVSGNQDINAEIIQTMATAVSYAHANLPTNPLNDNTAFFQNDEMILPPMPDIIRFMRRIEILNDPNKTLAHIAAGTLMPEHMETLTSVFPRLYQDQMRRMMESFMTKLPKLSPAVRNSLSRYMKFNLDPTLNFIQPLQEQYQRPPEPKTPPKGKLTPPNVYTVTQEAQVIGG